jgi:hypothetical protein
VAYIVVHVFIKSQVPFITVTVSMKLGYRLRHVLHKCSSCSSHARLFRSLDVVVVGFVLLCGCFFIVGFVLLIWLFVDGGFILLCDCWS